MYVCVRISQPQRYILTNEMIVYVAPPNLKLLTTALNPDGDDDLVLLVYFPPMDTI